MRVPELKALARDRGLRNYSRMRKADLVALLQIILHHREAGTLGPQLPAPGLLHPPPPTQTWKPIDDRRLKKPT